ncbi:MAG TPA: ribosome maturation factor RimM [Candidatus Dormibacteraeota bacterium]|nr:ribosome maturation factor RimM [Candidatus Dormibacteraeota bacterium]
MIRIGQVTGAYGVDGAVKVIPLTDFEDRFAPGSSLVLEGAERHVQWSRSGYPGLVVKLAGIDNRTVADFYRGRYLEVPDHAARELEHGRFYHHQVVGLIAVTRSGQGLGTITEVLERPANDVWVSHDGHVEHLIPATRDAVVEVDLEARRVVVADWLVRFEDA